MPRTVKYILYDRMNTEGQLFRVKKGCTVHFVPDETLIGKRLRFFTNYPKTGCASFNRLCYHELPLSNPILCDQPIDCFDNFFELSSFTISGSFHFYFSTDGSYPPPPKEDNSDGRIAGCGFLTIDPHFSGTQKDSECPEGLKEKDWDLDGVVILSCISKNMGYFADWKSTLQTSIESSYNMIHFTPVQELGYSGSAYSLRDQLKVNPNFTSPNDKKPIDWVDIESFIKYLENECSILSMADLVFNHTSHDSPWLHEHPECAYNVINSPHLAPAYILDHIVWRLSLEIAAGNLKNEGLAPTLTNPPVELPAIQAWLSKEISGAKLHEFFMADVSAVEKEFVTWLLSGKASVGYMSFVSRDDSLVLRIGGPRGGRRFGGTVNFYLARREYVGVTDHSMPLTEAAATSAASHLRRKLDELNAAKKAEIDGHLNAAIHNVLANARYRFYDSNGPRLGMVTTKTPIMYRYFYHPDKTAQTIAETEAVLDSPLASRIMAFNGWVMNDNPLRNFAEPESFVYLRRELIVWGDSAKLRYGHSRDDCPYLWDRMSAYAELTARIFHAVRLDNCHSTPLHVAQYMLDKARAVRPNLYVVAELFTGSEHLDNIFINKLGLNSLIRECQSAGNCRDFGSNLYRYGVTRPAGAFFDHIGERKLYPSVAHALLYDQTHDNPSVAEKYCLHNFLPLSALAAAACCAIGSTRGYDELVPHHIDVVQEKRNYARWPDQVNNGVGMILAKSLLNELHSWLSFQRFNETFVDQVTDNVVALTRISPETRESVVLVANTAYNAHVVQSGHVNFQPIELGGKANRLLMEISTVVDDKKLDLCKFERNPKFINGVDCVSFPLKENVPTSQSSMFRVEGFTDRSGAPVDRLIFHNFPPGSVVVVSVRMTNTQEQAISNIHELITGQFGCTLHRPRASIKVGRGDNAYIPRTLPPTVSLLECNALRMLVSGLTLVDLNRALFRCDAEERADGLGGGTYRVPDMCILCYCGFMSATHFLELIRDNHDLGHQLCNHLRNGDWLPDYLASRLCSLPANSDGALSPIFPEVGELLKTLYSPLKHLPRYLVPAYFEVLTTSVCYLLQNEVIHHMPSWITSSSSLVKRIAVATTQFFGFIGNCRIPSIYPPVPLDVPLSDMKKCVTSQYCSLAAGLPHFAEGMWRAWGRDTFIALRGCLLLTERYDEAAGIIISFASLLRHGLIPNLVGDGKHVVPRYNCRDAVWFWLYAIVCYEQAVAISLADVQPEKPLPTPRSTFTSVSGTASRETLSSSTGTDSTPAPRPSLPPNPALPVKSLLDWPVWRWFPTDDVEGWPMEGPHRRISTVVQRIQPLHEVIQEALQCHVSGIDFIERNAGTKLDEHMRPEGFHVTAGVNSETGFPFGGNAYNCGTWMDKMGSSDKAGNRGVPATPRDGSAVELVGLTYAIVSWLSTRHQSTSTVVPHYPHSGVQLPDGKYLTWSEWAQKLQTSFEPAFWISDRTSDPCLMYNKGIYRDSVNSSGRFTDNQLRPNCLVAMVVAPQLFTPERAWSALEICRDKLVGPIGMRTLGNDDVAYRGDYDNSNDSSDFDVARGFNYHQGPEWLWPTGFYLRARLYYSRLLAKRNSAEYEHLRSIVTRECQNSLARIDKVLQSDQWRSLPELTNSNGKICHDSCPAQAWSVGCIMEAIYDLLFATDV